MSKIRNAKGRTDGNSGYTRVLGNELLGSLLSKIQATVISNGSELERLIIERSQIIQNLDIFIQTATEGQIDNGVYLCLKKTFKQSQKYAKDVTGIEPDMLIFVVETYRVCKVIELKDGDAFDTKKSKSEKQHLEKFATIFGAKIPFVTEYYICSFNQSNKDLIKLGFKNVFDEEHILTGRELCEILHIDYDEILQIRKIDIDDNFEYFLDELLKIEQVRVGIEQRLTNRCHVKDK